MTFSTWGDLIRDFCSIKNSSSFYEEFSTRRYNYAPSNDRFSCRLIFLKDVLKNKQNKTLRRHGRFIWCRGLRYEGRNEDGVRSISFTDDKGQKRFCVGENNILCLPSNICVQNNRYFKAKKKTFLPFSTVFSYKNTLSMMIKNGDCNESELLTMLEADSPYRPGTLVAPRHGYFFPDIDPKKLDKEISSEQPHPCGIILGPSMVENKYVDKEFYRVRFGNTTYERVHPVQMEIVNEI